MTDILANDGGFPILGALILLPLLAAMLLQFCASDGSQRRLVLAATVLELALAVIALVGFTPGSSAIQYEQTGLWMPLIVPRSIWASTASASCSCR